MISDFVRTDYRAHRKAAALSPKGTGTRVRYRKNCHLEAIALKFTRLRSQYL